MFLKVSRFAVLTLLLTAGGQAGGGVYRVCYLRGETITICPVNEEAKTGSSCECPTQPPREGQVYDIEMVSTKWIHAENPKMCSSQVSATKIALCSDYVSSTESACSCNDRNQTEGSLYSIVLLDNRREAVPEGLTPRSPLAHADFLTRLKECCIRK